MKTIGIDTNLLISFRLRRKPDYQKIQTLIGKCLEGKLRIYIPVLVLLEIEWVLRSFYKEPKENVIKFLEELLLIDDVYIDDKDEISFSLNLYKNASKVSFTDCVVVRQIQSKEFEFLTSDRDLEKLYNSITHRF